MSETMNNMSTHEEQKILSLDEDGNRTLELVTKDGQKLSGDTNNLKMSKLIHGALDQNPKTISLELKEVNCDILKLVVEYMTHYAGKEPANIEKPLKSKDLKGAMQEDKTQLDDWAADFINRVESINGEKQTLYDVILAANYLDVRSLLHLGCAKVASLIKGEPLDKIKEILSPGKAIAGSAGAVVTQEEKKE